MAKTEMKKTEQKTEEPKTAIAVSYDKLPADLRKQFEEEALKRVAKAAGMEDSEVADLPAKEDVLTYNIGAISVHINGERYSGKGQGPRSLVETITSMAANLKARYIREMTDNGNQKRNQDVHSDISSGMAQ